MAKIINSELEELSHYYGYGFQTDYDEETGEYTVTDKNGRSHSELVTAYTEHMNKLNAVASVYQRLNRIITGEEITVQVITDKEMDTNAMNNGREIVLNSTMIEQLDDNTILSLHGVNYHELAHILFSPRMGSNLGIYIKQNKLGRAVMVLEEARSEQLLMARFPSTRIFLEANSYQYLLQDSASTWGSKVHVIIGRSHLPIELRQYVVNLGVEKYGHEVIAEMVDVINQYRNLVFPEDFDTAKTLLQRMAKIVGYDEEPTPDGGYDIDEDTNCHNGTPTKGRPAGGKEQKTLQGTQQGKPQEKAEPNTNKGDEAGTGTGENSDSMQEDSKSEDSDRSASIAEALNKRMEEIKSDKIVERELKDTRKAVLDNDEIKESIRNSTSYYDQEPDTDSISTARKFGQELERLVRNNDPAWNPRVSSGRLNIQRTMTPDVNAISEMFDQWGIGNEATDIEAVILMDKSGSMGGQMREVSQGAWIIKRGIETINGSVSVFSFNDDTEKIYDSSEMAKPRQFKYSNYGGGTNPLKGLIESDRILTASKKSIKLCFVITDGEWNRAGESDGIIKMMNDKGFITCVVFLGGANEYRDLLAQSVGGIREATIALKKLRHGAKIFHAVTNTKDLLKVATEVVKSTLKEKVR